MNINDLIKARDKVLATAPDDAEAVNRTIAEIEPLANECKKYLEAETDFWNMQFEQLVEILMKNKEDMNDTKTLLV